MDAIIFFGKILLYLILWFPLVWALLLIPERLNWDDDDNWKIVLFIIPAISIGSILIAMLIGLPL